MRQTDVLAAVSFVFNVVVINILNTQEDLTMDIASVIM